MYRIIFLIAVSIGLIACRGNDKVVSAWEVNDVYHSVLVAQDPATGGKIYQGPSINTMDAANTYEMFSLRSLKAKDGTISYELLVQLTYYNKWRYYDAATVRNKPTSSFKVLSREAGICEQVPRNWRAFCKYVALETFQKEQAALGTHCQSLRFAGETYTSK